MWINPAAVCRLHAVHTCIHVQTHIRARRCESSGPCRAARLALADITWRGSRCGNRGWRKSMRPHWGHEQRAVTGVKVRSVHVVHGGPGVSGPLGADGSAEWVRVMVVRGVPGLWGGLVKVAVQWCGGVWVRWEGKICVGGTQGAAERCCDRRLICTVPERGREASLAHREWSIWEGNI